MTNIRHIDTELLEDIQRLLGDQEFDEKLIGRCISISRKITDVLYPLTHLDNELAKFVRYCWCFYGKPDAVAKIDGLTIEMLEPLCKERQLSEDYGDGDTVDREWVRDQVIRKHNLSIDDSHLPILNQHKSPNS